MFHSLDTAAGAPPAHVAEVLFLLKTKIERKDRFETFLCPTFTLVFSHAFTLIYMYGSQNLEGMWVALCAHSNKFDCVGRKEDLIHE